MSSPKEHPALRVPAHGQPATRFVLTSKSDRTSRADTQSVIEVICDENPAVTFGTSALESSA